MLICSILHRLVVWGLFWLIKRFYGVAVNISGWSLFLPGFRTLTLQTANLELVCTKGKGRFQWNTAVKGLIESSQGDREGPRIQGRGLEYSRGDLE